MSILLPIANQNWLNVSALAAGVAALSSAEYPLVRTWSSLASYGVGAIVTGPDGHQYQAVTANTNIAPPQPGTWTPSAYTSPDRGLIAQSAVPLPFIPAWDARTAYPAGARVAYGAHQFVTPAGCTGVTPPTTPDHNTGWEYDNASQNAYTASLYVGGGTSLPVTQYAGIEWYDAYGDLIAVPSGMGPAGTAVSLPCYQRLTKSTAELGGTQGNTLGLAWTANPSGFWQVSDALLFPNPAWSGAQKIKLLYVADTRANCCVGVTCQSEVTNPSVADTGVLFRLSDTSNYWLAGRQNIQKMVAGTLTTAASFTRLPAGSRIYVQLNGSTIRLYTYPGNNGAPQLVTTVTDAFNSGATSHGLYYQVY